VTAFLAAFASTFVSVFALGLQSLNVNQRMYLAAALTSAAISSGHLWLYKVMPTATGWDVGGYYLGGIVGITVAIWSHPFLKSWFERLKNRRTTATGEEVRQAKAFFSLLRTHRPAALDEHVTQHFPPCLECGAAAGRPCGRLVCERWTEPTRH
jgi:hypothetical protein